MTQRIASSTALSVVSGDQQLLWLNNDLHQALGEIPFSTSATNVECRGNSPEGKFSFF